MVAKEEGVGFWPNLEFAIHTPMDADNVMERYIKKKLEAAKLEWVDFRVFRRTHASLMKDMKVDPKVVADQQGHTVDVNQNVYTQTTIESRIEAVQILESAMVN
jgi:integrase